MRICHAHPGMAVCMCLGSDTRGRITSNETTRTEKDSGYPGAVSQTEVSGFKGNSNSVECTTKADGRRERETGNCLSRLQAEVLQILQYLEQEKQTLKEWEEQWLEERRKYKEQFQQMEINRMEEEKSWSLWNRLWKKKQWKTQLHRKQAQMDQFVKQVLEEEKFSQEQKSLFCWICLEQGEEMEEVLYFGKILSFLWNKWSESNSCFFPASTNVLGSRRKPWNQKKKGKEE